MARLVWRGWLQLTDQYHRLQSRSVLVCSSVRAKLLIVLKLTVLRMYSFKERMASAVNDSGKKGWLVAILECKCFDHALSCILLTSRLQWVCIVDSEHTVPLSDRRFPSGAWVGTLVTGYLADKLSRRYTIILGERQPRPSVPT